MADEKIPVEVSEDSLDVLLEEDLASPTKPKIEFVNRTKKNPGYAYYLKVRPDLRDWWDDFMGKDGRGVLLYLNVRQFAKTKGKTRQEQEFIEEMIGPKPDEPLRIPWLGDWQMRRANGYWAPEQPNKLKSLVASLKAKQQSWEAVRSAAPFLVQQFAKYKRLEEQIDQAFGGQAFDFEKPPTDTDNQARFRIYKEMQKSVTFMYIRLLDEWMRVHGVDPSNPVNVVQINQQNNNTQINDPKTLVQNTDKEIETLKLARQLLFNSETFKLPLPTTLDGDPKKEIKDVVEITSKKNQDKLQ